jgi:hypothetical protein
MFPDVQKINTEMIPAYKSAPVAYTLDIGIIRRLSDFDTVVIECHDFFSCGLYGFADHKVYPHMLHRWFNDYLKLIKEPIIKREKEI